jgi:hypothetical protein
MRRSCFTERKIDGWTVIPSGPEPREAVAPSECHLIDFLVRGTDSLMLLIEPQHRFQPAGAVG